MPAYRPGGSVQPGNHSAAPAVNRAIVCVAACTRLRIGRTGERPGTAPGRAQRRGRRAGAAVVLPDELSAGDAPAQLPTAQYRLRAELDRARGHRPCTCLASSRMPASVSTATCCSTRWTGAQPLPRSAERIQLLRLPDEFVHDGVNEITIEAAATRYLSLSPVDRRRRRAGAAVRRAAAGRGDRAGDRATVMGWSRAVRAAVVAPAGAVVVRLLRRRRAVLGAAQRVDCAARPLLHGVHLGVWWTSMYSAFVVLLVIFCVRFAGWHWPRFDRTLWIMALAAPAVLYAAAALGHRPRRPRPAPACIGIVLIGVVAVGCTPGGGATWPACCCCQRCGVAGLRAARLGDRPPRRRQQPGVPHALRGPALHCPGRAGC